MVKVVRYGKRRVTCGICDSILEYEAKDVKIVQGRMNEIEKYIECPNCLERVEVSACSWKEQRND